MATKDFSNKQEQAVADLLGWDVVSGSGARPCIPGDITSDTFLGECKTHVTSGNKIFFSCSVWKKICDEASFRRKYPVLITDDGSQTLSHTWCLLKRSRVDSTVCSIVPLNIKQSINITVEHAKLKLQLSDNTNVINCGSVRMNCEDLVIMHINIFNELFGEH